MVSSGKPCRVSLCFYTIRTAYRVLMPMVFPLMIFGAAWTFLMVYAMFRCISEIQTFKESCNHSKILHFAHVLVYSNSKESNNFSSYVRDNFVDYVLRVFKSRFRESYVQYRLFWCSMIFFKSKSAMILGIHFSKKVVSLFLGRSTLIVQSLFYLQNGFMIYFFIKLL